MHNLQSAFVVHSISEFCTHAEPLSHCSGDSTTPFPQTEFGREKLKLESDGPEKEKLELRDMENERLESDGAEKLKLERDGLEKEKLELLEVEKEPG